MNDDRIIRLTALKNELAEIKIPNYPNSYWSLINSWIAKATPIIRRDWNEFLGDFQKIAVEPNNARLVYHNSDFSVSEQENRRQWKLDNLETDEVLQNILGFLDGLLTLPESPVSQKKKPSSKGKKTKSPVEILVAKYGLFGTLAAAILGVLGAIITAYFGYLGIRTQIEAPILATQTAESKMSVLTATSPSLSGTATADSIYRIERTQSAVLRYEVKNDTNIYEEPNTSARIIENVSAGLVVEFLKQDGDWAFVTYTVGNVRTTGWIQKAHLEIIK